MGLCGMLIKNQDNFCRQNDKSSGWIRLNLQKTICEQLRPNWWCPVWLSPPVAPAGPGRPGIGHPLPLESVETQDPSYPKKLHLPGYSLCGYMCYPYRDMQYCSDKKRHHSKCMIWGTLLYPEVITETAPKLGKYLSVQTDLIMRDLARIWTTTVHWFVFDNIHHSFYICVHFSQSCALIRGFPTYECNFPYWLEDHSWSPRTPAAHQCLVPGEDGESSITTYGK